MSQCIIFSNLPNWIQALAAGVIAALTYRTLTVLKKYAKDTQGIAEASVSQLKNTQMPFLALVQRESWTLENQGFGPAINIVFDFTQAGREPRHITALAPKGLHNIHYFFADALAHPAGVLIQYESLSGLKYSSFLTWNELGEIHTVFEKEIK
jgi:hypothetical protein